MRPQFWWVLAPALAAVGCDRLNQPPTPVKTVAAPPTQAEIESRDKGRFQIVHAAPYFPAMILLDTATGQTWKPCPRSDIAPDTELLAWCEMIRGEYTVPTKKKP